MRYKSEILHIQENVSCCFFRERKVSDIRYAIFFYLNNITDTLKYRASTSYLFEAFTISYAIKPSIDAFPILLMIFTF